MYEIACLIGFVYSVSTVLMVEHLARYRGFRADEAAQFTSTSIENENGSRVPVGALVSAVHTKPRFLNFAGEYAILYTAGRTLLPFKERGQSAFQHEPSVALTAARPIGNDAIIMATWSCFWPLWNGFRNFIRSHTETDVTGYPCTGPRILSSSFSNRTQKKHPSFFLPLPL